MNIQEELQRLERKVSNSSAHMRHAEHAAQRAQQYYEDRAAEYFDEAPGEPTTPTEVVEAADALPAEVPAEDPRDADPVVLSERLDDVFFGESSDPTWTPEATETAERLLSSMGQNADFSSVECRASLCRLESTFADLTSFHESTVRAVTDPDTGWPGPYMAAVVSDPHGEGTVEAVIYLGRDGVDLSPNGLAAGG
jgi:hypothetical protein